MTTALFITPAFSANWCELLVMLFKRHKNIKAIGENLEQS